MKCPRCNSEIAKEQINIQKDVAQCTQCDYVFNISESLKLTRDEFDMNDNPKGTWIKQDVDTLIIGATTRSPYAFFIVPFMVVWSGFSIGGIYGGQIAKGEFNPVMSLFGIPFIIGSVIFWGVALMAIWGKVELILSKEGGAIFTGIGKIGFIKTFNWDDVSAIKEVQGNYNYPGTTGGKILLEGRKRLSFGQSVKDNRRYYLYRALQKVFSNVKMNMRF